MHNNDKSRFKILKAISLLIYQQMQDFGVKSVLLKVVVLTQI
jgi:hypothetical protein